MSNVKSGTYWKSKKTGKIISVHFVWTRIAVQKDDDFIDVETAHCMTKKGNMVYMKVYTIEKGYEPSSFQEMFPRKDN
jgi:hypothetical protein